jgi:hypothetical protein
LRQQVGLGEAAALHERQGAGATQGSGRVGNASIGGFGVGCASCHEEKPQRLDAQTLPRRD